MVVDLMRGWYWLILGPLVVAGSFFGTLWGIDYASWPDSARADDIRAVKIALEKYRAARGKYPYYPSNPLSDLTKDLVGGGFIGSIPADPVFGASGNNQYYYASDGGQKYAILTHLKFETQWTQKNGTCLTGVNFSSVGWWPGTPTCPF